jgi:diguanylate cyclase (GGDEF)-like protein/PAS domain S-box-containing protein
VGVTRKQQEVQLAFDVWAELHRRPGPRPRTAQDVQALREAWLRIAHRLPSMAAEESFREHTELISQVLGLMQRAGTASALLQNPSPEVTVLSDVVAGPLPRAIEAMGQLRALGSQALVRRQAGLADRAALQERVGSVRGLEAEFRRQLALAFEANPKLKSALEGPLERGDRLVAQYLRLAEEAVVRAEPPTLPAAEYFAVATRAIDTRFHLYREVARVLREAAAARAARLRRAAWTAAGLLAATLVASAVAGVVAARSLTRPLGQLVRALERMEGGDLDARVGLEGQDEVAQVARTFDRVAAQLQLATRQEELLRSLASVLNRHTDLHAMLQEACPLLQELLSARSVWVFVRDGPQFDLVAAVGVPEELAEDDYRELRWQPCRCQEQLLRGSLQGPVNVVDCLRLENLAQRLPRAHRPRAHGSVPLRSGQRIVGLLNFLRGDWVEVDDRTLQLAQVAADTVGVAIERALHARAERARQREQEATANLARALLGVVDLRRIAAEAFAALRDFLPPDGVALLVRDPSESHLELVAAEGWPEGYRWIPLRPAGSSPVAWSVAHRTSTVEDLARGELPFEVPAPLRAAGVRTVVVLPLLADHRPMGALVLTYREPRALQAHELEFAAAVAGVAGVAVERALEHLQNRVLFEEVPVGLYRSTPGGRFLDVNRVLVRMLGYPDRESLLHTPATALYVDPEDRTRCQELLHRDGVVTGFETYWRRWDGSVLAVREHARVVRDASGSPAYYEGAVEDISARKHLEANLYLLANYDGLTGLFNRRRFLEEVARAVRQAGVAGSVAVLMVDLDYFKEVNDRLGPLRGDDVLRAVADLLRRALPQEAALARLGGDSFGLCVAGVEADSAVALGRTLVEAVRQHTVQVAEASVPMTASCGVALFPGHARDPQDLVAMAEVAMYAAKAEGRNRVVLASPEASWRARYRTAVEDLARLREAVGQGRLVSVAQPIVDLRSGAVSRYELLARVQVEGRTLAPSEFLDLAERHGLVRDIDLWICQQAAGLLRKHAGLRLHVNLSGPTLADPGALEQLRALAGALGREAHRLVVEVTERMALADLDRVVPAVEALKSCGFQLALDDFGTGVSSLYLLRHLPVDYVKVDRSFVRNLVSQPQDRAIVRSVQELCQSWGRELIAEGVEDPETLALLREMGVDYAQGFQLGRPAPVDELLPG